MFLRSIQLEADALPDCYPFTVPVIQAFKELAFTAPVTFLVGENGCGKSSLLEAIACGLNCPTVGQADVKRDPMLMHARELAKHLRFVKNKAPKHRLFFRAEDAIGFIRRVQQDMAELNEMKENYERTLQGEGRNRAVGAVRGQQQGLIDRYGDDPDAFSHGEWFINLVRERIHRPGLYLLDEPETPLSPVHQLTLLSIIKEVASKGSQFIIASHSPILMACPDAKIFELDGIHIHERTWDEVEHVAITRSFLADPESYLRHL